MDGRSQMGRFPRVILKTHILLTQPGMAQNTLEKIAQDLPENIGKVFPQKTDWPVI